VDNNEDFYESYRFGRYSEQITLEAEAAKMTGYCQEYEVTVKNSSDGRDNL
jgi:hypothetical protein